jgi:hypothetical protein
MPLTRFVFCGLLLLPAVFADEHNVDFDPQADFSLFRTFSLGRGTIKSNMPELNDELVKKKIDEAVRNELTKKGLIEKAPGDRPMSDLLVTYHLGSANRREVQTWIGPYGGAHRSVYHFTQGTLVVDLLKRPSRELMWRGIYRDDEKKPAKLSSNLPKNVQKLFEKYPPPVKK